MMVSKLALIAIIAAALGTGYTMWGLLGVQTAHAQQACGGPNNVVGVGVCHNNICANVGVSANVLASDALAQVTGANNCQQ